MIDFKHIPFEPHGYAQTNIQLYNQLLAASFAPQDLDLVRRCYDLAVALMSGSFRPSGKPSLAHLVGTASILAREAMPVPVVCAGLLHAVYAQGDWGALPTVAMRRPELQGAVGEEIESLVYAYTMFEWGPREVEGLRAQVEHLSAEVRTLATMRLANELEDALDGGLQYEGQRDASQVLNPTQLQRLIGLANELGVPHLAPALAQAASSQSFSPPESLVSPRTAPFTVIGRSNGPRISVHMARLVRTLRVRARPAARAGMALMGTVRGALVRSRDE